MGFYFGTSVQPPFCPAQLQMICGFSVASCISFNSPRGGFSGRSVTIRTWSTVQDKGGGSVVGGTLDKRVRWEGFWEFIVSTCRSLHSVPPPPSTMAFSPTPSIQLEYSHLTQRFQRLCCAPYQQPCERYACIYSAHCGGGLCISTLKAKQWRNTSRVRVSPIIKIEQLFGRFPGIVRLTFW